MAFPKILISHAHEEKALAEAWKELIEATSMGTISTWFSSDTHAEGGVTLGEVWREDLYRKLSESTFILAIQSPLSASRSWIMWECGVASGIDKERGIIPIVYALGRGDLANPLSAYQAYQGEDPVQVREVCERLARSAGLLKLTNALFDGPIKTYLEKISLYRPRPALRVEQMMMWRDRFEKLIQSGRASEVMVLRQMMYASLGKPFQPVEPTIHELLSRILLEQREYRASIEDVDYALTLINNDIQLLHRKALALVEIQDFPEAENLIAYIISLHDNMYANSEIASLQGRIHRERWMLTRTSSELDAAIEAYLRAYEANTAQYYPGINAAELALAKGDIELAEHIFQEILNICKRLQAEPIVSFWVDFTMGAVYLGLGDVDAAVAEYKRGLYRTPAPTLRDRESAAKGAVRMATVKKLSDEIVERMKVLLT